MPANSAQWTWFLFFALGALGGLTYLVNLVLDLIRTVQVARRAEKRE